MFKKAKVLTSDDFGDIPAAIDLPVQPNGDIFEFLSGREPRYPVHKIEGVRVHLEAVFYRHPTERYQLEFRVGNQIYRAATIQPGTPGVEKVRPRMTVVPPSPSELASREKQARNQQRANDIAEAEQRRSREFAIRRREEMDREAERRRESARLQMS